MKKQVIGLALAASLLIGGTVATASDLKAGDKVQKIKNSFHQRTEKFGFDFKGKNPLEMRTGIHWDTTGEISQDKLYEVAEKLGIKTEERKLEDIQNDVKAAMLEKNKDRILKAAEKLGIQTEGRTVEEIQQDMQQARINEMAKKLNIKTEGRTTEDIEKDIKAAMAEKHKEKVLEAAKKLGVATDGMTVEQIEKAVHQARIYKAAEELNVETENRTLQEIEKDLKAAKHPRHERTKFMDEK